MHSPFKTKRGSVLIVTLLLSAMIAIFITSYLQLSINALKFSNRSFYSNSAMNLVDTGLEQALWSINNNNWTGAGFAARSGHPGQYQGTFPSATTYYDLSRGVEGQIKVWADTSGSIPEVVAEAIVTLPGGGQIIKESEMYLQHRSYFDNGMVAKNSITFKGNNAMVDSWNSDPNGTVVPYSSSVAHDLGQVGSLDVQVNSIDVSNANIYGYAAVGGSSSSDISVGPQGMVGPYGTPNGTIDPSRVTYDFTTNFPDVSAPTYSSLSQSYTISAITGSTTLPRAGDNPSSDGKYYYFTPSISLSGNTDTLSIAANSKVVVVTTNTTGTTVSATGNQSGITIDTTSALTIYTAGNVNVSGNGILNGGASTANQPADFQLYGTRSASTAQGGSNEQSVSITGNGYLSGVVYVPNGNVTITGNGDVLGSVVGNSISLTGNANFHYDESLKNNNSSNLWSLSKWHELYSSTDRAAYAADLSF